MNSTVRETLISVIIPTYNSESTLAETLQSALNQTYSNLEILVADDGSEDETQSIVRDLAKTDTRIRLLCGSHTGHPGIVRNRALNEARGSYIAFLDSDDLWVEPKLEDQLQRIASSPESLFCSTSTRFLLQHQITPSLLAAFPESEAAPELRAPTGDEPSAFEDFLIRRRAIHTSSVLVSKDLLELIGPFSEDPALRSGQDDDFLLRAWRNGSPVTLPKVYVLARKRPDSVSAQNSWENVFEVLARAEKREPLPRRLHRKAWSAAWVVRGERLLATRNSPWKASMFRAWSLDPLNPRRFPALLSLLLPQGGAQKFYGWLRDWASRSRL